MAVNNSPADLRTRLANTRTFNQSHMITQEQQGKVKGGWSGNGNTSEIGMNKLILAIN